MSEGAFIVTEVDGGIVFANSGKLTEIPSDQAKLVQLVADFETTLKVLFPAKAEKYRAYFERLLSNAQGGLVGQHPLTALATTAVEGMKVELATREGKGIKTKYLVELGWMALVSAMGAAALWLFATYCQILAAEMSALKPYFVVWTGSMIGLWISYAVRRTAINYDELSVMDRRTTEAAIRVVFVGLVSTVFALFLSTGIMEFAIGDFKFHDFKSGAETAGLLGLLAGFSEQTLPSKLMEVGKKSMDAV